MSFNVLVVDDSAVMRSMIIRILRLSGLSFSEIYEASNGREGLDILDKKWVDLALVDINMPVMNGEEMIDQMKADPELANLPTIVISTEGSATRIERLENKGVKFIHKPFTPEIIRDAIQALTGIGGSDASTEIGDSDDSEAF